MGDFSSVANATTNAVVPIATTLTAPKSLRQDASKTTINQLSMVWDNTATNATGVEVWRSVGDESNWRLYETLSGSPAPSTYTDKSVRTGNQYFYRVRATRTGGELSEWSNTIKLLAPLVNSVAPSGQVRVYPNPFVNYVQVELGIFKKANIEIFNNAGIQVFEKQNDNQDTQTLNLQSFSPGLYWLILTTETQKQTFKIIKQ